MNIQVVQIPPIRVAMMRHTGSYEQLGPVFDRLWEWVEANQVPYLRTIGIYYDNPDYVPENQLRSAACYEIPLDYQIPGTGGQPIEVVNISGGTYATTRFVGPYEQLERIWTQLTEECEGPMRKIIDQQRPAFEVYVNDASETPANQLITELYMPLD